MTNRQEGLFQTAIAFGLLILWTIVWFMTSDLPDVAAAYPRFILMLLFLATGVYLVLAITRIARPNYPAAEHDTEESTSIVRADKDQPHQFELREETKRQRKRVALFMLGVLVYAIVIPFLGFDLSTAIFLVVAFRVLMKVRPLALVLLAVSPFVLQVVTSIVLGVNLPEGIWR